MPIQFAILLLLTLCLQACNNLPSSHSVGDELGAEYKVESVSFGDVKKEVFDLACLKCHSVGQEKPTLVTYDQFASHQAAIYHSVFELKSGKKKMPRKSELSQRQRLLLKAWLDLGAPFEKTKVEASDRIEGGQPPLDQKVEWLQVKKSVFNVSCNRCHKADNPWGAVDFTDVEKVRPVFNTIITAVLLGTAMPPREDPPVPLPEDWLDEELYREDENPNLINEEQKLLLYKWFLNNLK